MEQIWHACRGFTAAGKEKRFLNYYIIITVILSYVCINVGRRYIYIQSVTFFPRIFVRKHDLLKFAKRNLALETFNLNYGSLNTSESCEFKTKTFNAIKHFFAPVLSEWELHTYIVFRIYTLHCEIQCIKFSSYDFAIFFANWNHPQEI